MSVPVVRRALRVPGRLYFDCTDLTAAPPFGGKQLGFMVENAVSRSAPVGEIVAEEWGNEPVEGVSGGERWAFTAILNDADEDALAEVFLNTSEGSVTGRRVIEGGGTNRAGYLYGGRSGVLVFAPESVISGNDDIHRMVVFYNAMPHVQETADLEHRLDAVLGVPVAFVGIRDGSDRIVKAGFRADLSLA